MNKIWQAVGILFVLNGAILLFSFVYENTFAAWDSKEEGEQNGRFQFITLTDILTPDTVTVNENAEQLAEKLLQEDTVSIKKIKKKGKIDSAFLAKPADTVSKENKIYNTEALDNFFAALIEEKDNTVVRVGHYGDSQLEGDRVTQHIRDNLQAKFGGNGLGYVPFDDVASSASYTRTQTGTWTRYNVFNKRLKNGFYGLSGSVFRFAKGENLPDSLPKQQDTALTLKDSVSVKKKDTVKIVKKTDSIKPKVDSQTVQVPKTVKYTRNASVTYRFGKGIAYNTVSLMYGRTTEGFGLKCYTLGNQLIYADTMAPQVGFANKKLNIPAGLSGFKVEFLGNNSPDLYGLLIDDTAGVTVDNYAIRGHSGDGLFKIDDSYLATQAQLTNTRLIIFQYGANMIPYLDDEKECKYYEDAFYRLFMKFKKAAPNASILVIGNGDMGYTKGGESQSYEQVRCLSDVQKSAATRAGCAFWSLLDAMGGDNSILTWSRKGLCSLDGHLSPKGQRIMANLIFTAIMREYNNYIIKQQNP
jgi:hypothetical protein